MSSKSTSLSVSELPAEVFSQPMGRSWFRGATQVMIRNLADRAGILLSAICIIHCLLTPVVLLSLPALRISEYHESFHELMILILPVLAVLAFVPGYRRHRDASVFKWSLPGLALLVFAAVYFEDHALGQIGFSVAGSLLLIRAHLINRRLCNCCETAVNLESNFKELS